MVFIDWFIFDKFYVERKHIYFNMVFIFIKTYGRSRAIKIRHRIIIFYSVSNFRPKKKKMLNLLHKLRVSTRYQKFYSTYTEFSVPFVWLTARDDNRFTAKSFNNNYLQLIYFLAQTRIRTCALLHPTNARGKNAGQKAVNPNGSDKRIKISKVSASTS